MSPDDEEYTSFMTDQSTYYYKVTEFIFYLKFYAKNLRSCELQGKIVRRLFSSKQNKVSRMILMGPLNRVGDVDTVREKSNKTRESPPLDKLFFIRRKKSLLQFAQLL